MKVLSFNTGYFLGYKGTHIDYLKHPVKSIIGARDEESNLKEFLQIVNEENPDMILVQEVDGGSIRTSTESQHEYINRKISDRYSSCFSTKYRGYLYPKMPILRYMGNSVSQKLDLVVNSQNLEIKNLRELGNRFSDHRPISFEINN